MRVVPGVDVMALKAFRSGAGWAPVGLGPVGGEVARVASARRRVQWWRRSGFKIGAALGRRRIRSGRVIWNAGMEIGLGV